MDALLTAIVLWLHSNFGLPTNFEHPRMEYLPAAALMALRHGGPAAQQEPGGGQADREVVAAYVDNASTIYLLEGWSGQSPADLSVLVHEMVHHLQNAEGTVFACPGEREALAYKAQGQWLGLFGRNLWDEFGIDALTLLASTTCAN